jgi:hypothetical protein
VNVVGDPSLTKNVTRTIPDGKISMVAYASHSDHWYNEEHNEYK